jgi:PAS domain S-box-containing protein
VARQLDKHVQAYLDDEEDFVTAALVDIEHDGRFSVVLCGHPAPLVTHEGTWHLVEAPPAVPLGLGAAPDAVRGVLGPGDRMLLFTDGLLEARRADGLFVDPAPLWALAASEPFQALLDTLLEALQSWTGGKLLDDLALLSIQFLQPAVDEAMPSISAEKTGPPVPRVARTLPPEGTSVAEARRMVAGLLEGSGLQTVVDDAQVAVAELVTNALVHAGSEIHLAASVTRSGLRVEVGDASPRPPVRRDYAPTSATGRGLAIVEELVTRWDSFPLGGGKVVWFEIEGPAGDPFSSIQRPASAPAQSAAGVEDAEDVELRDVPLLMHDAWQEHASAMLREYLLAKLDEDPAIMSRHAAASDAMNVLHEQIPAPVLGEEPAAIMSNALEPHVSQPTLILRVPRDSVANFSTLQDMLRDAMELAATGEMLVPATQPEIQHMARWLCGEVLGQTAAERTPTAWRAPEPDQITDMRDLTLPGFNPAEVSTWPLGLLATNEASVIVAVSAPAIELLGYRAEGELVGRPVICVIPERYRQAHIAGTTLHAINGRDPLLGTPITVPVTRADGNEVPVELIVNARALPAGQRVFLAEFSMPNRTATKL